MSRRLLAALAATAGILAPLTWFWQDSLLPASYSVMEMGYPDLGGGTAATAAGHESHGGPGQSPISAAGAQHVDVTSLTGPRDRPADVQVALTARKEIIRLDTGQVIDGYTLNGSSPGPDIRARQGDLVEVTLVNDAVPDGVTLHWHGVDVPNAEDGVAGVTQDAVAVGERHVYRFVAEDVGTYWYHSHQVSHAQVRKGLFGALIVTPSPVEGRAPLEAEVVEDVLMQVHTYEGQRTIDGQVGERRADVTPGSTVRVRVINTDDGPMRTWVSGAAYRVVAVDGFDLHEPTPIHGETVLVTAGGRVDLELMMPTDGSAVRVGAGGGPTSLVLGPSGAPAPAPTEPPGQLDLLSYGSPAPVGFDPGSPDRSFEYRIGRRPGFLDGRPGFWWTINGRMFPDVPMYVVSEGDVVRMTLSNASGEGHPMHLHGHHALVLSRNGVPATGSPWWVDSLHVGDGETYELAFVADNPGVWMDHCHNLPHAAEGLMAHLVYDGVSTPFRIGGPAANAPE